MNWVVSVWRLVTGSVWAPLLGKLVVWTGTFFALVHVGSGAVTRLGPASTSTLEAALSASSGPIAAASSPCPKASAGRPGGATTSDGKVILNRAGLDDLVRLPGVGRKRAEAILKLREKLGGRFRSLRDLLRIRGLGWRSLKKLKPHVVLDAAKSK